MVDKRINVCCKGTVKVSGKSCDKLWLVEPIRPVFMGSVEELHLKEVSDGRQFNKCYCGNDLYGKRVKVIKWHLL